MVGSERPAALIRHSGGGWRAPSVTSYSDEQALELLLEQTPDLLPGQDTGLSWATPLTVTSSCSSLPSMARIDYARFLVWRRCTKTLFSVATTSVPASR